MNPHQTDLFCSNKTKVGKMRTPSFKASQAKPGLNRSAKKWWIYGLVAICLVAVGVAGISRFSRNKPILHAAADKLANAKSQTRISPSSMNQRFAAQAAATSFLRPVSDRTAWAQEVTLARSMGDGAALRRLAEQIEAGAKTPHDMALARSVFEEAAKLGDTFAKLRAGQYAQRGIGGKANGKAAASWYESAAADGNVQGYTELAKLFIEGRAVPVDLARADGYLGKALSAGNAEAMFVKGLMLLGTSGDPALALDYLVKAAVMNNADAQLALSRLYAEGKYVPADPALAAEWALAAEQNGSAHAKVDLANYFLKGDNANATAAEVSDSVDRLLDASSQKNVRASLELAALSLSAGNVSRQDIDFAKASGQQAYDAGTAFGAFVAAAANVGESAGEALQWLKKGAAGNDWRSKHAVALIEFGDLGVAEAIKAAAKASFSDFTTLSLQKNIGAAPMTPPAALSTPMPRFPTELLGLSIQGSVTAEFTVSDTGSPVGIQVLASSHPQLEQAAREAIARWSFKPAVQNGRPVPLKIRVPIRFRSSGGS